MHCPQQLLPLLDTYLACYMKHIVLCNWSINVFLYLFSPSVSIPQGYIAVLLLLAFWFVVHRKMTRQRTECVGGWMGLCMRGCSNDLHCPPPSLYPLPLYPSIHPLPPLSLPPSLSPAAGEVLFFERKREPCFLVSQGRRRSRASGLFSSTLSTTPLTTWGLRCVCE